MLRIAKRAVKTLCNRLGYDIVAQSSASGLHRVDYPPDFDAETIDICQRVRPFTMTSPERIFSLCRTVEYIVQNEIPGDIVECGVWKGGSMMAVAHTLTKMRATRKLHLFDTFEGMTQPSSVDKNFKGELAAHALATSDKSTSWSWAYSGLEEVKSNLQGTGYDLNQVAFIKGKVEESIPQYAPAQIAVLRLDTDWYESTYHELRHLYPRLSVGGVLIIDDYGHWEGARKAVDQYIAEGRLKILLNRVDYTGRIAVKLAD